MKSFSLVCMLLLATAASAGVRIETVTRDIKTQAAKGPGNVTLVQDGKARFTHGDRGAMILKDGVMYMVDDQRKSYRAMDQATLKSQMDMAGTRMKQMQERMAQMPPAQREQMMKMMPQMAGMANGKEPVFASKDTGQNDTVDGRKCHLWQMLRDGQVIEELCVVPFSSLPGKEDMQKTFKQISEAFAGMAQSIPGAGNAAKVRNEINGYPIRTRPYQDGKPQGIEIVLKSWTEESVPAATFEIPKGYKKEEMPRF